MGTVYEAVDLTTGDAVALKRLLVSSEDRADMMTALFQREYHTLSRLKHPSVIDAYEYAVDDLGPFYTMELLAGDDLRALMPLPYLRACTLLRGVASALCLLHTRHLVHRDITSRNIRVVSELHAKLLDFGALAQMGSTGPVIGTPPFIAPEGVYLQPLDARSDLFSLGVVLYQALCGALPYRGRTLDEVRAAWKQVVPTVHDRAPDVPIELSQLVMSMIAPDRAARPRDAAQVVERLSVFAGLRLSEPPSAARSYLVAPDLVGRDPEIHFVRQAMSRAAMSVGAGIVMTGPPGVGRSRLLQAAVLEATVAGASVLRAGPDEGADGALAGAQQLAEGLLSMHPELAHARAREDWDVCRVLFAESHLTATQVPPLARFEALADRRAEIMRALRHWFLAVGRDTRLVIAVDDVERVDDPSAAWLSTLLQDVSSHRIVVLACLSDQARHRWSPACRLLCELSHELRLSAFRADQVSDLVVAVFGAVPHVDAAAERVFQLSQGIARDAIALCEYLVDAGIAVYQGGTWSLPANFDGLTLPDSMASTHAQAVVRLSPWARYLGRALSLITEESLTIQDCVGVVADTDALRIRLVLEELTLHRMVSSDGYRYRIVHSGWSQALLSDMEDAERTALHLTLAEFYRTRRQDPIRVAHHLLLAARRQDALDILLPFIRGLGDKRLELLNQTTLDARHLGRLFERAMEATHTLGRPPSERAEIQYFMMMLGIYVDVSWFESQRVAVLDGLKRDSGYVRWQQQPDTGSDIERVLAAIQGAQAEFDNAPLEQRRYNPEQAIRALVQFTGVAAAVGAQTCDWALRRTLPDLLRPFICLSPVINVMFENALSVTDLSYGRYEQYRDRSLRVLEMLADPAVESLEHIAEIRAAVTYGVSSVEARTGDVRALGRLATLADNPRLRSNAMDLQAYVHLQQGDWQCARLCKRRVEQLNMEGSFGQMFGTTNLRNEAEVYALGGDLSAVKQVLARLEAMSQRHPGWLPSYHSARAEYERLRGDLQAASDACDESLSLLEPLMDAEGGVSEWYSSAAGKLAVLVDLGLHEAAREYGKQVLARAGTWLKTEVDGVHVADIRVHGILRALALAEASLGQHAQALARLEPAIASRLRLGSSGVYLGILYEAQAQVALESGDAALHKQSVRLACEQFSLCEESGFTSRRVQLMAHGRVQSPIASDSRHDGSTSQGDVATSDLQTQALTVDSSRRTSS